jgi:CRISPR-associated protein Csm2
MALRPNDLLQDAKRTFGSLYDDLLNMQACPQLDKLNHILQKFIEQNVKGVSSSQLRKLYDEVLKAQTSIDIKMLRPLFAYTIARQSNEQAMKVMLVVDDLAKKIDETGVDGFKKFMETLVAYHKYYEVVSGKK